MSSDEGMDAIIEAPTVNDVDRLVAVIRRQNREIAYLRGALGRIADAANEGHGPYWIEDFAREALTKDFRI